ncbi:hypothetical protein ASG14_10665 [Pedobacter sp. Leaf194]|nr:hypothetical protein ASG14_10665 [Pedobacter sp. Leaf194]
MNLVTDSKTHYNGALRKNLCQVKLAEVYLKSIIVSQSSNLPSTHIPSSMRPDTLTNQSKEGLQLKIYRNYRM